MDKLHTAKHQMIEKIEELICPLCGHDLTMESGFGDKESSSEVHFCEGCLFEFVTKIKYSDGSISLVSVQDTTSADYQPNSIDWEAISFYAGLPRFNPFFSQKKYR